MGEQHIPLHNHHLEGKTMTITTATAHCESCGSTDYEDLHTGDQGYTACCNELVCDGRSTALYGTLVKHVRACCWAQANEMGIHEGYRL